MANWRRRNVKSKYMTQGAINNEVPAATPPTPVAQAARTIPMAPSVLNAATAPPVAPTVATPMTPTTPDAEKVYKALQTLMGAIIGQQFQPVGATINRTMKLDKGTNFDKFLKVSPPTFMGTTEPAEAEA
ncbi:unnamed protein product [Ilex paraguariensis]|uniref:Uncharacterized protein n=1 Tax=Ilex paraguariensis TaxID=185542 RepID=A0ABC8QM60_9AQUA